MKVLIVDDEAPARERLKRLIADLGNYELAGEAANGMEAVQLFNKTQPDIVLLDIRMPVMDGIEAAQHLSNHDTPPAVIFTTAYGDHALQAFETHAVDYLLKPIRKERLEEALAAAKRTTRAQTEKVAEDAHTDGQGRQHICVRQRGNLELIAIEDVIYFFAEHKYVTLKHSEGDVLIEESLISLEKEFGDRFMRVHRNCLVATERIHGLDKLADGTHRIVLTDCDDTLEVSRRHLSTVRKLLRGKL